MIDEEDEEVNNEEEIENEQTEEWDIYEPTTDPFEEFDASYELDGIAHNVTIKMEPPPEGSNRAYFVVIDANANQSILEYDTDSKGWYDKENGETDASKIIGALIEQHYEPDDSPKEDFGIDETDYLDPSKPFTAWYKLFGKRFNIRIEAQPAPSGTLYRIYNLDTERLSDIPDYTLQQDEETGEWRDVTEGPNMYTFMIGLILNEATSR